MIYFVHRVYVCTIHGTSYLLILQSPIRFPPPRQHNSISSQPAYYSMNILILTKVGSVQGGWAWGRIPTESVLYGPRTEGVDSVRVHLCLFLSSQQCSQRQPTCKHFGKFTSKVGSLLASSLHSFCMVLVVKQPATAHKFDKVQPDLLIHNCNDLCSLST